MLTGLFAIIALALAGYLILLAALALGQRRILYVPNRATPDEAAAGIAGLEVWRVISDGLSLLAWFVPPPRPDGPVVLYLHGNGDNIGLRASRIRHFAEIGWGTLLQEYRGYGGNPGTPSEAGLAQDALAGLTALRVRGYPPGRILIWGESLGSGLAVRLGTEQPVAAVLLESPYTSIADIARGRYPYVPVDLLLRDRFDSLGRIGAVRAPVLVMQGSRDTIVPPAMGRKLFEAANDPKRIFVSEAAGHFDLVEHGAILAAAAFVRDQGIG